MDTYLVGLANGNAAQLSAAGVHVEKEWPGIRAARVRASAAALDALVQSGILEYYEPDARRYALGYTDGTYTWGLQAVKVPEAWNLGATGSAIRVCVLDTGIDYRHPAFGKNKRHSIIKGSQNFVDDGHADAMDGNDHGSHVTGTITAQTNASGSYIGAAPNIELYVGRIGGVRPGRLDDLLSGHPPRRRIALIDRGAVTFAEKVSNVKAQGARAAITVNNDTSNPDDPGWFSLGSACDWIPTASISYNSGIALRANGLGSGTVTGERWDYDYYDGTSMATLHVTAAAALAWSANPTLTNADIRTILQNTALDLGPAGRDREYGYGLVQADAAVTAAAP